MIIHWNHSLFWILIWKLYLKLLYGIYTNLKFNLLIEKQKSRVIIRIRCPFYWIQYLKIYKIFQRLLLYDKTSNENKQNMTRHHQPKTTAYNCVSDYDVKKKWVGIRRTSAKYFQRLRFLNHVMKYLGIGVRCSDLSTPIIFIQRNYRNSWNVRSFKETRKHTSFHLICCCSYDMSNACHFPRTITIA